jgi:hypothetical protein
MATGPGFAAANSAFIPNYEASGRLTVGFSRNPNRFPLAKYVQYVPVTQGRGYYLKITAQEAARVINLQDYDWPDGHNRPMRDGLESFNWIEFTTKRYESGFTIGEKTAKTADWPLVEAHSQIHAAKAMTHRAIRALTVLTTAANWATTADPDLATNHHGTATGTGGGVWSTATTTNLNIKKTLDSIAQKITLDTIGVIGDDPANFMVVVNPVTMKTMGESAEIHDYIKGSYHAREEILQGLGPNNKYGMPSTVYGYPLICENTVRQTSRKGATLARSYALADNQALFLSRLGGIEGVYGTPSFSTFTIFALEEFSIERFDDAINRLVRGSIVDDTAEALTCPASGWFVSNTEA